MMGLVICLVIVMRMMVVMVHNLRWPIWLMGVRQVCIERVELLLVFCWELVLQLRAEVTDPVEILTVQLP